MEYAEALKKVQARKTKDNFMVIQLSYNTRLLLSHNAGIAFLNALANAEVIEDIHSGRPQIKAYERDSVSVSLMSGEEYEQIRIATLLNVTVDDVKTYATATQ